MLIADFATENNSIWPWPVRIQVPILHFFPNILLVYIMTELIKNSAVSSCHMILGTGMWQEEKAEIQHI